MKKTLIAIAALAATSAFAQSSVTISGLMDAGVASYNIRGNKVMDVTGSGASGTTAVIFAGTEDLGGGMKALFQYEIDPNLAQTSSKTAGNSATGTTSNVTSSLGNGQSFVGAETAMGTVKLGAPNLSTLSAHGDGNSGFSTAIGSGYRVSSFDAVRFQSAARYDTPVFNGFSGSVYYVGKNAKQSGSPATGNSQNQQNGRDGATEYGLAYANGPLTARYAQLTMTQDAGYLNGSTTVVAGPGGEFTLKTASIKYAVNPALTVAYFNQAVSSDATLKLGGTSAAAATTSKYDRKTNGVSAAYQATPVIKVMVNYQQVKNGAAATGTGTASKTTTVTGLGADYALSKRTTAFVRYETNTDNADIRATTGYTDVTGNAAKYTATAVGLRHTF